MPHPSKRELSPPTDTGLPSKRRNPLVEDSYRGRPRYEIPEDEIVENDSLHIVGETIPDATDDDIPVRLLTDFTIYEWFSLQLQETGGLLELGTESEYDCVVYGASGVITPYRDDDEDEDDDDDEDDASDEPTDPPRVKLSEILEFNVHYVATNPDSGELEIDPKIYLRTQFAWYILNIPSKAYFPLFVEFWIKHRILHLVITASISDRTVDRDTFVRSLKVTPESSEATAAALRFLSRELTENDLLADSVRAYICTMLDEICADNAQLRRALSRVPLIHFLRGTGTFAGVGTTQKTRKKEIRKRLKDIEKDVLQHRSPTVVTPTVARIARGLFVQTLRVAGQSLKEAGLEHADLVNAKPDQVHYTDPARIEWVKDSRIAPHHYKAVIIDGVKYSTGDTVMVEKGADSNRVREKNAARDPSRSANWLANAKWFCQIAYMFERQEQLKHKNGSKTVVRKYFHARWLQHGSQMLLQETAHPNGLFFLSECDDLPLECIYQRCDLRVLVPGEPEPADEPGNNFFTWLTWDPQNTALVEIPGHDLQSAQDICKPWKQCPSCGLKSMRRKQANWCSLADGGISRHGVDYHINDFIYLLPTPPGLGFPLYKIAQIIDLIFDKDGHIHQIEICYYGRYDLAVQDCSDGSDDLSHTIGDNRRLFRTHDCDIIEPDAIEGKAFVAFLKSQDQRNLWLQHDDHFYVDLYLESDKLQSLEDLKILSMPILECSICKQKLLVKAQEEAAIVNCKGPLRGLELFAGAGGLSTGLELSGFVKTKWAIEFSPSAAMTYQKNHPDAIVYNQDTNILLQHALDVYDRKKPMPLQSLGAHQELPSMPMQGEVDFIYGGPPCQSFSVMNHYKKADDIRNTLVCNMLSYVEFYRPLYFLLENVTGLLFYRLNGRQEGRSIVDGIQMGVVKFILRALISLGYQVHFKVLQAGQYGAPQGRRRVIFWGAKQGVPLPRFPLPTHCFYLGRGSYAYKLPTGDVLNPATNCKSNMDEDRERCDYHQYAPLLPVTVNDAISDLPRFDWCNPFVKIHATQLDFEEAGARLADGIRRFDAVNSLEPTFPGFTEPTSYAHPPMNRYQIYVREGAGFKVRYHYTRRFAANIVERVVHVPMLPGADHVDLPRQLRLSRMFESDNSPKKQYNGIYGRIDGSSFFKTALTTVAPNCKGGRLLHPNQKRILTVRECARAQGFPDTYEFHSVNTKLSDRVADQHRQIGNAVPVPLALALGKELGKALTRYWIQQDLEDQERLRSPEL